MAADGLDLGVGYTGLIEEVEGGTRVLVAAVPKPPLRITLQALEKLGIDPEKYNVNGGSISIGHPFAATGARQITQTLRELKRRGGNLALCTACAAGGLGAAMVLEAE